MVPVERMLGGEDEKGGVDLGNAAHYDVHDASQGFSVKTEDTPGTGTNPFLVAKCTWCEG